MLASRSVFTHLAVLTVLTFSSSAVSRALADGLRLEYEEQRSIAYEKTGGSPAREEKATALVTVCLGPEQVMVTRDSITTIYDFTKRRILTLYPEANVYVDRSLYWVPGFRVSESGSRSAAHELFSKVGTKKAAAMMSPFRVQHELGVSVGKSTAHELTEERQGKVHRLLRKDRVVAQFEASEHALEEPLARAYARFLRYDYPVHPAIQSKIRACGRVLSRFTYHTSSPGRETDTILVLKSASPTVAEAYKLPEGMTPGHRPGKEPTEVERIGFMVLSKTHKAARRSWEEFSQAITQAVSQERYFEALLLYFEGTLQHGPRDAELLGSIVHDRGESPRADAFLTALVYSVTKRVDEALSILKGIDQSGVERAYVIDVFIATTNMMLGHTEEAEGIYLSVLRHNPYITGVYKDLGDIYFRSFKHELAWFCWDVARSIAPEHKMLRDVTAIEQELTDLHPKFF